MKYNPKSIAKFLLEVGMLKNTKRTGWQLIGVRNPESVADHSYRVIIVGYLLAKMENANVDKVIKMLVFHDITETRLGDLHMVAQNYLDKRPAELKILSEQMSLLHDLSKEIILLVKEMDEKKTKEAIVAKDADYLEAAIQAKQYIDSGHKDAQDWIDRMRALIKTQSAKLILDSVEKSKPWWKGLKKPVDEL